MTTELVDTQTIDPELTAIERLANDIVVADAAGADAAQTFRRETIRPLIRRVDETFDDLISEAHRHHKALVGRKRSFTDRLEAADRTIDRKVLAWHREQSRIAEQARREAEAAARAEQARLTEIARREEEDRRLAEATRLEAAGHAAEAEELLEAPVVVAPIIVPAASTVAAPKVEGFSVSKTWKARVRNMVEFVRFVAANDQFIHLLLPDEQALNQMARAQKSALSLPGIEVVEVESSRTR